MRGHEQIVQDRRQGRVPPMVWIDDGFNDGTARMSSLGYPLQDHIEIKATESPKRLDLRCVVGLVVHVCGEDEKRVGALARACLDAGAARVIAACHEVRMVAGEPIVSTVRMTTENGEIDQWPK